MTIQEDVVIPVPDGEGTSEEPLRETWVGEQVRLLTLEDGFA